MAVSATCFYSRVQVRACFTGLQNNSFRFYWLILRLDTRLKSVCVCVAVPYVCVLKRVFPVPNLKNYSMARSSKPLSY